MEDQAVEPEGHRQDEQHGRDQQREQFHRRLETRWIQEVPAGGRAERDGTTPIEKDERAGEKRARSPRFDG